MNENPSHPAHFFTAGQRRVIALALSCAAVFLLAGAVYCAVALLRAFIAEFGTVIWPLVIAGILSTLLRPLVIGLEKKLNIRRVFAIVLLYFLVVVVCVAMGAVLLPLLVSQLIELAQSVPDFVRHASLSARETLRQYPDIQAALKDALDEANYQHYAALAAQHFQAVLANAPAAFARAGSTLRALFEFAAALAVIPIYLFFLLESDHRFVRDLREQLIFVPPPVRVDVIFLVGEFRDILIAFFRGRLLIGLIMGVLKGIGFSLIGIQGGLILGLIFGFLNIVPYLGTILGLAFILPIAYFQPSGGGALTVAALVVFAVVELADAYYITPKIMGQRTGLHPMVIIVSIFFWGQALHGLLGIILAVPLTAFLVVAWRLVKNKYLPRRHTMPPMPIRPPP
jgi:predicted PurR-regulated permease PerM